LPKENEPKERAAVPLARQSRTTHRLLIHSALGKTRATALKQLPSEIPNESAKLGCVKMAEDLFTTSSSEYKFSPR
jgi:hypothetical protein